MARLSRDGGRERERVQQKQYSIGRSAEKKVDRNFAGVCKIIDNIFRASLPQSAMPTAPVPPLQGSRQREPWRK